MPSWLGSPGPVLLKRHVKANKHKPLVDVVKFVHDAPSYAKVRFPSGRETLISLRDIAPTNEPNLYLNDQLPAHDDLEMYNSNFVDVENNSPMPQAPDTSESSKNTSKCTSRVADDVDVSTSNNGNSPELRRSLRIRRPPDRLEYH